MTKGVLFRLKIIKNYVNDKVFGSPDYKKFVLITRARSGSNLLISLLNSHEQIFAHGEAFRRPGDVSCKSIYSNIFPEKSAKAIGFKIFYQHPYGTKDRTIWDLLKKDKNIKIIHLKRENLLRVHVSLLIAEKTDQWRTYKEKSISLEEKKVYVDVEKLLLEINQNNIFIEETKESFKNHQLIEVTYKDIVKDQENTLKSIFKFLGMSPKFVKSEMKRQNPEKLEDLILNYNEVNDKLSNTENAFMLK